MDELDATPNQKILFLPGAAGDGKFWYPVGERLADTWEKHYLNWPGLGNEPPDPSVNSIQDLCTFAEKSLVGATVVVAQSMGGVVAIELAARYPERVTHLVLVATSGGLDATAFNGIDWRRDFLTAYPATARWIMDERPDLSERFSKVVAPTLLLWGDEDPISPVAIGEYLKRQIPCAEIRVIPGGKHSLAKDTPGIVAFAIAEWIAGAGMVRSRARGPVGRRPSEDE